MNTTMKRWTRAVGALAAVAAMSGSVSSVSAQETIKVGVLHSLSGTMAIRETTLKDVMLMLIDGAEQEGRAARQEA